MINSSQMENHQLWLARITDLAESGLSQREWCVRNNQSVSTLRYWIRRLRDKEPEGQQPQWLKVNVPSKRGAFELDIPMDPSNKADALRVSCKGFTVEVPEGCNRNQVRELFELLQEL